MFLGAVVDLGLPLERLRAELARVPLAGYAVEAHRVHRAGLHATKVDVRVDAGAGAGHRGLREILGLIERSGLEAGVKERVASLFRRLATAEAAVHGTEPEQVHFHEMGAIDSIVDIVGGVVGLAWLRADRYLSSPLNVGTGTVTMSHGTFPVPPPPTAPLHRGVPAYATERGQRRWP